jgi:hypothetical protein
MIISMQIILLQMCPQIIIEIEKTYRTLQFTSIHK